MGIRILYIVSTLRQSGPTNQLYSIIDNLSTEFDPFVLTLSSEPEDSELGRYKNLDARLGSLNLSRIGGATIGPLRLRSAVSTIDPDVIHTQGIRADTLSATVLRSHDRVATIRNHPYKDYPAKYGDKQGRLMARTHLAAFRRLDRPVACSRTIAKQVGEFGLDPTVIQNGVDCEQYQPVSDDEQRTFREDLGLPNGNVIVYTGSLIDRKDPETAIEGFLRSELGEEAALVFLGDGALRDVCESVSDGHDNVRFEGWVDDVESYLGAADYFVSPSKAEGLPNSVMEALASGLPVCLSGIGPHKEILEYDRNAGVTFPVGDADELATALETLVEEGIDQSDAAEEIARTQLSAESMSEAYQELYWEVADGRV